MAAEKNNFFDLVETNLPDLERFALHLSRNRTIAKDIVSETVVRAYDSFAGLRCKTAFKSWLFTIASRYYFAEIKRSQKYEELLPERFDNLFLSEMPDDSAHDIELLNKAVDQLDDNYRQAIILSEIIGMKHKEIAVIQNTTTANVKLRVFRAKQKLKKILCDAEVGL